jgi:methionine-rich copper-binding protein CopC
MSSTRGTARPFILLLAIAALFGMPAVVAAHAEVVRATPAAGSTATEPVSEVSATYSEDLTDDSRLGVFDQDGARIAVGRVDPANMRRMVATFDPAVLAGTITVRSTAISTDRHIEKTQWTFTVAVPPTPSATPAGESRSPAPSATQTSEPTATATASPTTSPSPAPGSNTGSGSDVILPIIGALAIITIGAALLLSRGRGSGAA